MKVRTRAAIRVVQRVVGDCVTEERSRVRVKFVGQMTDKLREFLETSLPKVNEAPNLVALIGEVVGARLIFHAGSLTNLAKCPSSTLQKSLVLRRRSS
ncbi:nucleolar protein 56-like protein, partial [Tanacetum coccineum]